MKRALLLLLCTLCAASLHAEGIVEQRCREFLTHFPAVHSVATGTQVAFTGRFTPIPASLTNELRRQFPDYTFRIANMTYLHWGPDPVRLLLVSNRGNHSVRSYLWDVDFSDEVPFSFAALFRQQGESPEAATARITVLARLLCFQMGGKVGKVTFERGIVFAELVNRRQQVRRIIRSRVQPDSSSEMLSPEPLAIVHPDSKYKTPAR